MFTGLIQGMGRLERMSGGAGERRLEIRPDFVMENVEDGESIAVNGACLSVERHGEGFFTAYASAETISRTTLGDLPAGASVNLERALRLGDRLGGHIVSGHVDCVATVRSVDRAGQSLRCVLNFPASFAPEVIPKGSVALDGISLTVNECGEDFLTVNIIPDTQSRTTMLRWRRGVRVNMETDVLGKYVRRSMERRGAPEAPAPASGLDDAFLRRHGFL